MKLATNLDFQQNQLLNGVLQNLGSPPSSPKLGQKYFSTSINGLVVWNGSQWRPGDAALLTDGSIQISALATNPLARANHTGTQTASTISNLQATVITYTLDTFAAPVANMNFGGYRLTNIAQATTSTDAARWDQVQSAITAAIAGQTAIKNPVRTLAATNITLSGLQTIDGVSLAAGDRVLATAQSTAANNGIWVVASGAWTLATDAAATGQLIEGTDLLVNEGSIYAGSIWRLTTSGTISIGTTAQTWTQTAKVNSYTADGVTIQLTGSQFSVVLKSSGGVVSSGSGLAIDATLVVQKYTGTITGDGTTTSFAITHNLNNSNPIVGLRDSGGNAWLADNVATSASVVTVSFGTAPISGATYSVTVHG